jgi:DMSO/TMAO reductase YedYZ molybdopterin-dependent catalytic subunit
VALDSSGTISPAELRLAARNHGLPLEALAYDVTPAGMHYLLTHYDIPLVDPASFRLRVGGLVGRELSLSLEELRARPAVTHAVTLECAGNGRTGMAPRPVGQPWVLEAVGTAEWTGTPLRGVLEEAGIAEGAVEVRFGGLDVGTEDGEGEGVRYERSLSLADAQRDEVLLVYAMNGQPLLPQHGAPLRLVVPGWYGMASVKWLDRIALIDSAFHGYHQTQNYCLRQAPGDEGVPLSRMQPRSLLIPPGIPDSGSRERTLAPGPLTVRGRAWSGLGEIARVEASADGGASWSDARLAPAGSRWAWRAWEWEWDAQPGEYELCCRATDATGAAQPLEAPWNLGGYVNNEVQRVPVTVSQLDM